MAQQPVNIIGAGIGGLTLARSLSKRGIPYVLYERQTSIPRHSYGITLHPSSYRPLLKILGLDEHSFRRRVAVDGQSGGQGNINTKRLVHSGGIDPNSFRAHRGKLEQLLREGLEIQWNHSLEKAQKTLTGTVLRFQNGRQVDSTCTIGADGPHSSFRTSMAATASLNVLPIVAFNGKRHVPRDLFERVFAPIMADSNLVELRQGDVVMQVAINEKKEDQVSLSWVYSRPSRGSMDSLHKPDRPLSGATEIPAEFYEEVGAMKGLDQLFEEVFDQEKLKTDRILHWLMRTTSIGVEEFHALACNGIFFMGDAAHAQPILGGQGANNAIKDGIHLAFNLSLRSSL